MLCYLALSGGKKLISVIHRTSPSGVFLMAVFLTMSGKVLEWCQINCLINPLEVLEMLHVCSLLCLAKEHQTIVIHFTTLSGVFELILCPV